MDRSRLRSSATFVLLAVVAPAALLACNAILNFDQFHVGTTPTDAAPNPVVDAAGDDGGCIDPTGFGGKGCFRCTPQTSDDLLNACTTSTFEAFDNAARIQGFDPNVPMPPLVDGGPALPAFDAGASGPTTTTDAGDTTPSCTDTALKQPNPVMVLGGTGYPLDTIAKAMGSAATIIFLEGASCDGVATILLNSPKMTGKVVWYSSDGNENTCKLDVDYPADIGSAGAYAETCAGLSGLPSSVQIPSNQADFLGPANPVMFTAPARSVERVISAEAAYKVYGFGSASGVTPWIDESFIYRRTPKSANQQSTARTLGLPVDALRGVDSNGGSKMYNVMLQTTAPDKTIGISSSEIVDIHRDTMKSLAYQHYGQRVGFYPDSSTGSFDRKNVRDGHYFMWIPLHVFTNTSAGDPVAAQGSALEDPTTNPKSKRDAAVKALAFVMANRQEAPNKGVDVFGSLKTLGNIPQCAMHVTRAKEAAVLSPYTPSTSCDCAFEAASPGDTPAGCQACADSTSCPSTHPTCSFGYCE